MTPSLIDPLLHHWRQLLSQWARDGRLSRSAQAALQLPGESAQLEDLLEHWGAGDFSGLPPVDVLPASSIAAARGAYAISKGTIYLNGDWLRSASRDQALAVLTEELGHHLEALLKSTDTPGDEGELFALLLHGDGSISEEQQQALLLEDDRGFVTTGGQVLLVEQAGRVVSTPIPAAAPGRTRGEWGNLWAFAALKADGSVVTWGLEYYGGDSSAVASQLSSSVSQIFSTRYAFAALKTDGSVVTWGGDDGGGGDSSAVASQLSSGVSQIFSTFGAFAALKADGSVVTWGISNWGGDSSAVASQLSSGVSQIFSTRDAFAALKTDGSVVTWGGSDGIYGSGGGDSSAVASQLSSGVSQIFSNFEAFAALKTDGSVVTWGGDSYYGNGGGDSSAVASQLSSGVSQIFSTFDAFAALKADGSVVTWGGDSIYGNGGGDSSAVASQLSSGVSQIFSTASSFAALKTDGSVVTWGREGFYGDVYGGGDSSAVASQLSSGVSQIFSNFVAFAALKADGSVVTWGGADGIYGSGGGDSSAVASQLSSGVSQIFSTSGAFAALKTDGSVVTWGGDGINGDVNWGGDSSAVASQLSSGVSQIFSTEDAFAALKADGSVVTWGGGSGYETGGDSSAVASQLNNVVAFANPFTDDRLVFDADLPAVTLAVSPTAGVTEDGTSNLVYTFSRTGPIGSSLTVNYTVDGTAILGSDYVGISASPATRTVSFVAGSFSATVTVDPTADTTIESNETVEISLAEGTGYTMSTTAAVVGTILNDDKSDNNLPEITLAVGPITEVLEDGREALLFTFTRKGSTVSPLGVNYAVAGTATPGVDYTGINASSTTQTLSFASGADSATLRLISTADPWIEPDETVSLTLLPGTDYTAGTTTAVSGTIRNDEVARLSYTTSEAGDNSFTLRGSVGGTARLMISLADAELNAPYDLALFTVDDLQGRIDGLNPSDPAYSRVALPKAKNVFSAISNLPQGFNPLTGGRVLELNSGDHFRFMLLEKGTLDTANQKGEISDILISSIRNVAISQLSPDQYILSWNDSAGNGKTRNLRVKIQATDEPKALGTNLQDNKQGEMLDLSGVDPAKQVLASFVVNREAGYNNVVGFYKITDSFGSITDPVTGATLKPGDTGYTQTALRYRVAGMDLQVANQSTASGSSLMQAGSIFAPFIVANGSPEQLLDANPSNDVPVYFPFLAANSDGIDHIRLLADNTFGFEDLPGGGDLDYNDMTISVGLAVV